MLLSNLGLLLPPLGNINSQRSTSAFEVSKKLIHSTWRWQAGISILFGIAAEAEEQNLVLYRSYNDGVSFLP